jgi:methyltransferase-like protein/cyclopropane fatty-acyl-phospholipid synthase-like methyltransferase
MTTKEKAESKNTKQASSKAIQDEFSAYDNFNYEGYPFAHSSPVNLKTTAKVFGVETPDLDTARVLEIGAGSGTNLKPFAITHPKAKCVGVDVTKTQAENGKTDSEDLGITNLELKNIDIGDIDKSFGEFDYIICHEVYSQVTEEKRQKIFEIAKQNLSSNGLAYISYNTLPGWNMVRSLREMMLYHTQQFSDTQEKINQARLVLNFVKDTVKDIDTPYSKLLQEEAENISRQSDYYILHEYMNDNNFQQYFHEFVDTANQNGLKYLADANLASMFLGNLPEEAANKLSDINDIVRTEQYMDFIYNRRFRTTILCHDNLEIDRGLSAEQIKDFYMTMRIGPEKAPDQVDLNDRTEELKFYYAGGKENYMTTSSPAMKAILYTFAENVNYPLSFDKLITLASRKVNASKEELEQSMLENAMRLVLADRINLTVEEPKYINKVTTKPKIFSIANKQANVPGQFWFSTASHAVFKADVFAKLLAMHLDGEHTISQLKTKMFEHHKNGDIQVSVDDKPVEDEKQIKDIISDYTDATLNNFANSAMLVA